MINDVNITPGQASQDPAAGRGGEADEKAFMDSFLKSMASETLSKQFSKIEGSVYEKRESSASEAQDSEAVNGQEESAVMAFLKTILNEILTLKLVPILSNSEAQPVNQVIIASSVVNIQFDPDSKTSLFKIPDQNLNIKFEKGDHATKITVFSEAGLQKELKENIKELYALIKSKMENEEFVLELDAYQSSSGQNSSGQDQQEQNSEQDTEQESEDETEL